LKLFNFDTDPELQKHEVRRRIYMRGKQNLLPGISGKQIMQIKKSEGELFAAVI